jgi:hypothetical protein
MPSRFSRVSLAIFSAVVSVSAVAGVYGQGHPCRDILFTGPDGKGGIKDEFKFSSKKDFLLEVRRMLSMSKEDIEREVREGKVSAGFAYKVLSLNASDSTSDEKFKQLKESLDRLEEVGLSSSEEVTIEQAFASEAIVKAWGDCMKEWAKKHKPEISFETKETDQTVNVTVWFEADPAIPLPKITDVQVVGGVPNNPFRFKDNMEVGPGKVTQIFKRDLDRELVIVINTDKRGSVLVTSPGRDSGRKTTEDLRKQIDALKADRDALKTALSKAEEAGKAERDKAAEAERLREKSYKDAVAAERITQVKLEDRTSKSGDAGSDATFTVSLASASGKGTATMPDMKQDEHERGDWTKYPWVDISGDVRVATLSDVSLAHNNIGEKPGWKAQEVHIWARTSTGRVMKLVAWHCDGKMCCWWATDECDNKIDRSLPFRKPEALPRPK